MLKHKNRFNKPKRQKIEKDITERKIIPIDLFLLCDNVQ